MLWFLVLACCDVLMIWCDEKGKGWPNIDNEESPVVNEYLLPFSVILITVFYSFKVIRGLCWYFNNNINHQVPLYNNLMA